jgi:geranylgeranyl pyrophosphate synthase
MIDIEKLSAEKARIIDREIEKVFPKEGVPNLNNAVWYHMDSGGKRLRPLLALMTCEALGGRTDQIAPFAAACEVLHNWFLVHDDIEDGDKMRRDKPALWVKFGLAHGINAGDYMSQKVFELILLSGRKGVGEEKIFKLLDSMVKTSVKTAEGQAMDINLRSSDSPTENQYMDMVTDKTAHYLTVPMVGGAIVAGREEIIPHLIEFGSYIGPAFQIIDDVIDLTDGKGRGETGRDVKEGKRSILVVHCLSRCTQEEKEKLMEILNRSPDETTDEDVLYAKSLFGKHGSVDYAKAKAEALKEKAMNSVKKTPEELHEILEFFADYLVNRKK